MIDSDSCPVQKRQGVVQIQIHQVLDYAEKHVLEPGEQHFHTPYVKLAVPIWQQADKTEVERAIRQVEWKGFPIGGKLDKIEHYSDGLIVVDYKTGNPVNAKSKLHRAGEVWQENPGGDYWRQIVFYQMLVSADRTLTVPMKAGVMEFVEPSAKSELVRETIQVTAEDLAIVEEQLAYAFDGIRSLEFSKGCHEKNCFWCNLVDHHVLGDSLTSGGEDPDLDMEFQAE